MVSTQHLRTREMTVFAQDPSVKDRGGIIRTKIKVPAEYLRPGPWGYRVQVVDYDTSTNSHYKPLEKNLESDPFENASDRELLSDPQFHCQNVYAHVMRTLSRFEYALGRRISWGFYGHHLKVMPHAFADANAFYSPRGHVLMFGYFPSLNNRRNIFTCLSHDIIVHETTHALLDGLRERYTDPSSPDQAAFHEGFADIVALLSVFTMKGVAKKIIDLTDKNRKNNLVSIKSITPEKLKKTGLLGLAEEMGQEIQSIRGDALRRSVDMGPSPSYYCDDAEWLESHRRGEILVAAVINTMLKIWCKRMESLGQISKGYIDSDRVAEEAADIADMLLTIVIRALDYCPPVDIKFGDFLSALLTADQVLYSDDSRYHFRETLVECFASFGISPASTGGSDGCWDRVNTNLNYDQMHFSSMQSDEDEVFRFIWENRKNLILCKDAYSRVISVRPCFRIGPDGFILRETVAEFLQTLELPASQLKRYKINKPKGMKNDKSITLYGGSTLVFDEFCRLQYEVHNDLLNTVRQQERLNYLWENGFFEPGSAIKRTFANIHRMRSIHSGNVKNEEW